MAKTTKQTPEPNKKPATSLERFEAKLENVVKPSPRLPRMGCFWIFGIFLFFAVGFATAYYHSVGEIATTFEIPEGRVTISDSEGVLLEQDQAALEALANERGAHFIDVPEEMYDSDSALPANATTEGIHPNLAYDRIWAAHILMRVTEAQ